MTTYTEIKKLEAVAWRAGDRRMVALCRIAVGEYDMDDKGASDYAQPDDAWDACEDAIQDESFDPPEFNTEAEARAALADLAEGGAA